MTLADLRALAAAATEDAGSWFNADYLRAFIDGDDEQVFSEPDIALIAALSPERITALLDVVEAARRLRAAERAVEAWDPAHGYIVNSERDELTDEQNGAMDALDAALARLEEEQP